MADQGDKKGTMVSIRFPSDEFEAVRRAAENSDRTISAFIRDAIATAGEFYPKPMIMVGAGNFPASADIGGTVTFITLKDPLVDTM